MSGCEHRKFKLLFVLEKPGEWKPGRGVLSELSAVNARLFAFARQMAKRGHRVQVADPERFSQVLPPQKLATAVVTEHLHALCSRNSSAGSLLMLRGCVPKSVMLLWRLMSCCLSRMDRDWT